MTIQLAGPRVSLRDALADLTAISSGNYTAAGGGADPSTGAGGLQAGSGGGSSAGFAIFDVSYADEAMQTARLHFGMVDPADASVPASAADAAPEYARIMQVLEGGGGSTVHLGGLLAERWNVRIPGSVCPL